MREQIKKLADLKADLNFRNKQMRINEVMKLLEITDMQQAIRIFRALTDQEKLDGVYDRNKWNVFRTDGGAPFHRHGWQKQLHRRV